jgi:CRP-like cAMP-binding protein
MDKETISRLEAFFQKHRLVEYKKGEVVFRPGDIFNYVGFIKSGYIRLYSTTLEGKEITYNFFKPVFYLSVLYSKLGKENKYYFETVTPCEIWFAPKKAFFEYLRQNQDLSEKISDSFMDILQETLDSYEQIITGSSTEKIAAVILSLGDKYGEVKNQNRVALSQNTTHQIIASLTGVTRETVSLQLSKLEKLGFITKEKKIIIINPQKIKGEFGL